MLTTGWYLADPLLSAGIGGLILWSSWRLLRESVEVLLEATPKDIDPIRLRTALGEVEEVAGVHDLHIWTVTSGLVAMSGHVEVTGQRVWHDILMELIGLDRNQFGIAHVTLQPEDASRHGDPFRGCSLDAEEGRNACRAALRDLPSGVEDDHSRRH